MVKHYAGLSLLKGLAAFGIVGCHLFFSAMTDLSESILHFCDLNVAIFGAISGFLLLMSFEHHLKDYILSLLKHRFVRIAPAYASWTLVFVVASALLSIIVRKEGLPAHYLTFRFWKSALFFGGSSTHLWYLAHLFWWSCLLLLLWKMFKWTREGWTMVLFSLLVLLYCVRVDWMDCAYSWRLLVFMAQGAALYRWREHFCLLPKLLIVCAIMVTGIVHLTMPIHSFVRDWLVVWSIVPLFANERWKSTPIGEFLGANSFGVYLVHPLLTMASSMAFTRIFGSPTIAVVLVFDWVIVCVLASGIAWAMRRWTRCTKWMVI